MYIVIYIAAIQYVNTKHRMMFRFVRIETTEKKPILSTSNDVRVHNRTQLQSFQPHFGLN